MMRMAPSWLLFCLVGCGGASSQNPTSGQFGNLRFTLSSDKPTYTAGEQPVLTFTITNTGAVTSQVEGLGLTNPQTQAHGGGIFSLQVLSGQSTIWLCPGDCGIEPPGPPPEPSTVALSPGDSLRTVPLMWPRLMRAQNGTLVAATAGTYTVSAFWVPLSIDGRVFTAAEMQALLSAAPITITIQ